MRTATSGQLAALLERSRTDATRVWVADHTDTLQDVSADVLAIPSLVIDVNTPARTGSVVLRRETASGSLSPLIGANPAIYAGRRIRIEAAVKAAPGTIGSGEWVRMFDGFIGRPSFGGRDGRLTLPFIDHWSVLVRTWLKTVGTYGNDTTPVAIGTLIQQLVDAAVGSSVYTLDTIGTPTTTFVEFEQRPARCADALVDVINRNGWDLRFAWSDAQGAFVLTLQQPPRTKTTPDYTFAADGYLDVPDLAIDPDSIVNSVGIEWTPGTTEVRQDSGSVSQWGERYVPIDSTNDPQITDATLAAGLGDIIVADRANPLRVATVVSRLNPFLEIWDLCRFPADDILHDSALDLAVSRVTHSWPESGQGAPTTTLDLAGAPSGGVDRWERLIRPTEATGTITRVTGAIPDEAPQATVSASFDDVGALSATLDGRAQVVKSWKVKGAIGTQPTEAEVEAEAAIDGTELTEADIGTLATATDGGDIGYVAAIGYTRTGGGGIATAVLRDLAMFGTPEAGIPDASVGTSNIKDGAVGAGKMSRQARSFTSTVTFFAPSQSAITWTSGAVVTADGASVTVSSRTTHTITGTTFIYFDGTTTLKETTNRALLADDDVILLATAWPSIYSDSTATIVPAQGALESSSLNVGGESLAVGSVRTNTLAAASVVTDKLAANAVTAGKIFVLTLDALAVNAGTLISGLLQNSAGTTFVDLDATGTDAFIKCGTDLVMRADGSATFDGLITSTSMSATTLFVNNLEIGVGKRVNFNYTLGIAAITADANGFLFDKVVNAVTFKASAIEQKTTSGVKIGASGDKLRFFGGTAVAKPTVSGGRASGSALTNLLIQLDALGLITDSTTA